MVITLRHFNKKNIVIWSSQHFAGINSKLCHFIVDNRSHFISSQFWVAPTIGYVYMYSWVLNNSTGAVDCIGERGEIAGIINCTF